MACNVSTENYYRSKNVSRAGTDGAKRPKAEPGGHAGDMGKSVTPHVGITNGERYKFLSCGIDSLDIAGYVKWPNDFHTQLAKDLDSAKEQARQANKPLPYLKTNLSDCLVYPGGKPPMYRYHIQSKSLHLYIGISQDASNAHTPNIFASLLAKTLWKNGLNESIQILKRLIEQFGGKVIKLKPSRLDLCCDFLVPDGLSIDVLRNFGVPNNIFNSGIFNGGKLETYYIGSRKANIRARVYDKAKEVIKHDKTWFKDVWGVQELLDVWRVEFQLRREALKAYGVDEIETLEKSLGGIWKDLSENWYSLRLADSSNTSRRSFHPFWMAVQSCAERFGEVIQMSRNLKRTGKAKPAFYSSRALTNLIGFAAASGFPELEEALVELCDNIRHRITDEEFNDAYTTKQIQMGDVCEYTDEEIGGENDIPF